MQKGAVSSADGDFAFERTARAENIALAELNRVLRTTRVPTDIPELVDFIAPGVGEHSKEL